MSEEKKKENTNLVLYPAEKKQLAQVALDHDLTMSEVVSRLLAHLLSLSPEEQTAIIKARDEAEHRKLGQQLIDCIWNDSTNKEIV